MAAPQDVTWSLRGRFELIGIVPGASGAYYSVSRFVLGRHSDEYNPAEDFTEHR